MPARRAHAADVVFNAVFDGQTVTNGRKDPAVRHRPDRRAYPLSAAILRFY